MLCCILTFQISFLFLAQSPEEIVQFYTTLTPPTDLQRAPSPFVRASDVPDTLDLRQKGLVTSVKMQVKIYQTTTTKNPYRCQDKETPKYTCTFMTCWKTCFSLHCHCLCSPLLNTSCSVLLNQFFCCIIIKTSLADISTTCESDEI